MAHGNDLINFEATELRLGLPGTTNECHEEMKSDANNNVINFNNINSNKRASAELVDDEESGSIGATKSSTSAPAPKAQIVGWPPVRSYRKSNFKKTDDADQNGNYVKVSMDGAPYLRKIDLKIYNGYSELLKALETMFKLTIGEYSEREGYKGSEYAPAYEDKDGDLMLVGDVPWNMFMSSCKRLRIMKGSDARGLGCAV